MHAGSVVVLKNSCQPLLALHTRNQRMIHDIMDICGLHVGPQHCNQCRSLILVTVYHSCVLMAAVLQMTQSSYVLHSLLTSAGQEMSCLLLCFNLWLEWTRWMISIQATLENWSWPLGCLPGYKTLPSWPRFVEWCCEKLGKQLELTFLEDADKKQHFALMLILRTLFTGYIFCVWIVGLNCWVMCTNSGRCFIGLLMSLDNDVVMTL